MILVGHRRGQLCEDLFHHHDWGMGALGLRGQVLATFSGRLSPAKTDDCYGGPRKTARCMTRIVLRRNTAPTNRPSYANANIKLVCVQGTWNQQRDRRICLCITVPRIMNQALLGFRVVTSTIAGASGWAKERCDRGSVLLQYATAGDSSGNNEWHLTLFSRCTVP